jgi:hypothetical protein
LPTDAAALRARHASSGIARPRTAVRPIRISESPRTGRTSELATVEPFAVVQDVTVRPHAVGLLLFVLGTALALVSAFANALDLGVHGFGWKQIVGIVVGVTLAVAGGGLVLVSGSAPPRRL